MSAYNKFWVAILMVAANAVRARYDINLGLDEQMASDIVAGIGAALVWFVPNKVKVVPEFRGENV